MKSLLESNPYLADPKAREAMIRQNALESAVFEGARGLLRQGACRKRRRKAVAKKAAKGS